MKPNLEKLRELVKDRFNGNKSAFATAIGMDRGHVSKVLKDGSCAGVQFFGKLYEYCDREKLNFKDYYFMESSKQ